MYQYGYNALIYCLLRGGQNSGQKFGQNGKIYFCAVSRKIRFFGEIAFFVPFLSRFPIFRTEISDKKIPEKDLKNLFGVIFSSFRSCGLS